MALPLSTAAFAETYGQWDRLRQFEGFDPDEFVDQFECSAAEDDFAERVAALERRLLGRPPESLAEVICMLEVISVGEDIGSMSNLALGRIQTWLGGQMAPDAVAVAPCPDASAMIAVARPGLAML